MLKNTITKIEQLEKLAKELTSTLENIDYEDEDIAADKNKFKDILELYIDVDLINLTPSIHTQYIMNKFKKCLEEINTVTKGNFIISIQMTAIPGHTLNGNAYECSKVIKKLNLDTKVQYLFYNNLGAENGLEVLLQEDLLFNNISRVSFHGVCLEKLEKIVPLLNKLSNLIEINFYSIVVNAYKPNDINITRIIKFYKEINDLIIQGNIKRFKIHSVFNGRSNAECNAEEIVFLLNNEEIANLYESIGINLEKNNLNIKLLKNLHEELECKESEFRKAEKILEHLNKSENFGDDPEFNKKFCKIDYYKKKHEECLAEFEEACKFSMIQKSDIALKNYALFLSAKLCMLQSKYKEAWQFLESINKDEESCSSEANSLKISLLMHTDSYAEIFSSAIVGTNEAGYAILEDTDEEKQLEKLIEFTFKYKELRILSLRLTEFFHKHSENSSDEDFYSSLSLDNNDIYKSYVSLFKLYSEKSKSLQKNNKEELCVKESNTQTDLCMVNGSLKLEAWNS